MVIQKVVMKDYVFCFRAMKPSITFFFFLKYEASVKEPFVSVKETCFEILGLFGR